MTTAKPTDIVVVLDRSGSMISTRADAIGGFNTFLKEQQGIEGDCYFTLVQFDDQYEVVHDHLPIAEVPPLTDATFVPRGSTALLDAVGRAIGTARDYADKHPGRVVIFAILTDGEENASKEYTLDQVRQLIQEQQSDEGGGWAITFLAAHADAFAAGRGMGINPNVVLNVGGKGVHTRSAFDSLSANVGAVRSTGSAAMMSYDNNQRVEAGADHWSGLTDTPIGEDIGDSTSDQAESGTDTA